MAGPTQRNYTSGYFELELDGVKCGHLQKVGGGALEGEVIKVPRPLDFSPIKHIGNPKFEDLNLTCGLSMGEDFRLWVTDSLDRKHTYKSGAIVVADYNLKAKQRREFTRALIHEVGFPVLDATQREVANLTVKLSPEDLRFKKGDDQPVQMYSAGVQSRYRAENFRLTIDGIPSEALRRVSKIEALTMKQTYVRESSGFARIQELVPGAIEYSNIKVTMAEVDCEPIVKWFHDFVTTGQSTLLDEKNGMIELMTQDFKTPLMSIDLMGLGIFKLSRSELSNNDGKAATITFELYCEKFTITKWEE
jgi:hypothetical protein